MLIWGYDTDDLTDRQNYVFHKLYEGSRNNLILPKMFLVSCVSKNISYREFTNYDGDCDYLLKLEPETLKEFGIDMKTLYEDEG